MSLMLHEQYGQLLLDAIRETLETMAFAEIIPYSMKVGDKELVKCDKLSATVQPNASPITDRMWANPLDAWEDNVALPIPEPIEPKITEQMDFGKLINEQDDWCWACMKVNSPELDCIWFIVSKQLGLELANTMYAGDDYHLDHPVLRDIIAELTNVFGGRLMLLLEEAGDKFTLEVPTTGTGQPDLPDNTQTQTVTCKVFVDNTFPVISVMSFKE